jgi:hypothetical protein
MRFSGPISALFLFGSALVACGEQYCQHSAKSGTQCYTINEVEWQETQVRAEPPPERSIEPAPGCVLNGDYVVPPPGADGGASRPQVYVMSGACVSRRLPVGAAVR